MAPRLACHLAERPLISPSAKFPRLLERSRTLGASERAREGDADLSRDKPTSCANPPTAPLRMHQRQDAPRASAAQRAALVELVVSYSDRESTPGHQQSQDCVGRRAAQSGGLGAGLSRSSSQHSPRKSANGYTAHFFVFVCDATSLARNVPASQAPWTATLAALCGGAPTDANPDEPDHTTKEQQLEDTRGGSGGGGAAACGGGGGDDRVDMLCGGVELQCGGGDGVDLQCGGGDGVDLQGGGGGDDGVELQCGGVELQWGGGGDEVELQCSGGSGGDGVELQCGDGGGDGVDCSVVELSSSVVVVELSCSVVVVVVVMELSCSVVVVVVMELNPALDEATRSVSAMDRVFSTWEAVLTIEVAQFTGTAVLGGSASRLWG
ncbi:unnamed protein product [Lampetra fluviatilis]